MQLNKICEDLAARTLGKKGTIVEHIFNGDSMGRFKVLGMGTFPGELSIQKVGGQNIGSFISIFFSKGN